MLSENIRFARIEKGLSVLDIADLLGCYTGVVNLYERGELIPTLETIIKLSELLGVSTDWLLKQELFSEEERRVNDFHSQLIRCWVLAHRVKKCGDTSSMIIATVKRFEKIGRFNYLKECLGETQYATK